MDLNVFKVFRGPWKLPASAASEPQRPPTARQSVELPYAALDASDTGAFRWNIAADVIECDSRLDRLFGCALGASSRSLDQLLACVHAEDYRTAKEAFARCAREGGAFDAEFRTLQPDESTRRLHVKGRAICDSSGIPREVTGACIDLDEWQQNADDLRGTQPALSESEARLRALIEDSPLGILMMDLQGCPIYYNPKCEEIHGMNLREASGAGWARAVHPADRDHIAASWREAASEARPWAQIYRFLHRDGRIVWVSGRAGPMYVDAKHVGFVGVLEDITSLKLAEEAVRRSEAKLRRIGESGMVGVFYWNADLDITESNDKFLRMLGYSREDQERGGLNIRRLTPARWQALCDEKFAEVMTHAVATPWEQELCALDGAVVPVLLVIATLDEDDQSGIAICLDITERKQAEAERAQLLEREQQARRAAEQATRARDEAMWIVAHDLRNPLQIFNIILKQMRRRSLPDNESSEREFLTLQQTAQRMEALIRDLLDVARIDSGTFAVEQGEVRVPELLTGALDAFDVQAREGGLTLSCDVERGADLVIGDRVRLEQALWNLLGNAIKFTPRQGRVTLRARPHEGFVQFSVEDTGIGIPADQLAHIFDRFWQVNRKSGIGTGLGLAIAKGIIGAHGGQLWVESIEGKGTTFHFTIPSQSV